MNPDAKWRYSLLRMQDAYYQNSLFYIETLRVVPRDSLQDFPRVINGIKTIAKLYLVYIRDSDFNFFKHPLQLNKHFKTETW